MSIREPGRKKFENPKSMILMSRFLSRRMFSGFKSLFDRKPEREKRRTQKSEKKGKEGEERAREQESKRVGVSVDSSSVRQRLPQEISRYLGSIWTVTENNPKLLFWKILRSTPLAICRRDHCLLSSYQFHSVIGY